MKKKKNNTFSPSIKFVYNSFKKKYSNLNNKNWSKEIATYLKDIQGFSGDKIEQRMIFGWLAGLCERAYYVAAHKKSIKIRKFFEDKLKEVIFSKPLPKFLTEAGPVVCGKSQPSFFSAFTPTLDRYQIMELLPEAFQNNVDSIIIGGSMSYSPFFGIRENKKARDFSDIDGLVVINDNFFKKNSWDLFLKNDIFPLVEKKQFISRIKIFKSLLKRGKVDVFSQRFSVCGKLFTVSLHFVTKSVFEKMVHSDLKNSLKERNDLCYTMRDFRVDPFFHPCHARHTFDGRRVETVIDGYDLPSGGFIAMMPGYIVSDGNLYPGVYQTVISTAFLVFYDKTGETKKLVRGFKNILYKETKRAKEHFILSSYSRAHNRYDIFPPGRFENGHNSYVSPEEQKKYLISSISINPVCVDLKEKGVVCKTKNHSLKNNSAREKAEKKLDNWKRLVLKSAEDEVSKFLNDKNLDSKILFFKNKGLKCCTVISIPNVSREVVKIPYPYLAGGKKNKLVCEEVIVQIITPWEVMRLRGYEKLARKFRKVYVASIIDPSDAKNKNTMSYAIVVSVY